MVVVVMFGMCNVEWQADERFGAEMFCKRLGEMLDINILQVSFKYNSSQLLSPDEGLVCFIM